ncbi:hypothetical protein EOA29_12260 [Mesorhizobium sp. M1E.F.Ca.ET.063.01.1.1]|nr:hypothetical protein EOA29_12260 [Mesorhizobium sp. M1E.F.Ca.ET.063.01.1.1]
MIPSGIALGRASGADPSTVERESVSPFHGNGEPLYLFVLTQFRTENRYTLFLELLQVGHAGLLSKGNSDFTGEHLCSGKGHS